MPGHQASDIIDILKEDHDRVLALFARFERIRDRADDQEKQILVEAACTELAIHSHLEEETLYPALRQALERAEPVEEAEVEHMMVKHLVGQLETMQAGDPLYDARFAVLGEYVKHHIRREQERIFPMIRQAGSGLGSLAQDIRQQRHEMRSEFGVPDQYYPEEEGMHGFPFYSHSPSRHH